MVIRTRDIIDRYIALYLVQQGVIWTPKNKLSGDSNKSTTKKQNNPKNHLTAEDKRVLEEVCQCLHDISDEMHEFIIRTHKDQFSNIANSFLKKFDFELLEVMMDALFDKEFTWNHIVTFLVYGANLAQRVASDNAETNGHHSDSKNNGTSSSRTDEENDEEREDDESDDDEDRSEESTWELRELDEEKSDKVSQIVHWICNYIDSNLLQWIENQEGGWRSIDNFRRSITDVSARKGSNVQGLKHYIGVAAFAVVIGGLYLRSKLSV